MNEKCEEKHNEKREEKQVEKSNAAKGTEANKQKPRVDRSTQRYLTTHWPTPGALQSCSIWTLEPRTTSFLRETTHVPIKSLRSPLRYLQPTVKRSMLTVPGPCAWQCQPTAWDEKQIYRMYITHLTYMRDLCR